MAILASTRIGIFGSSPHITWIADFLTSREQCVRYHSICSRWLTLNVGVQQGTKLGPILFLVMINDVRPMGNNLAVFKYAGDL